MTLAHMDQATVQTQDCFPLVSNWLFIQELHQFGLHPNEESMQITEAVGHR